MWSQQVNYIIGQIQASFVLWILSVINIFECADLAKNKYIKRTPNNTKHKFHYFSHLCKNLLTQPVGLRHFIKWWPYTGADKGERGKKKKKAAGNAWANVGFVAWLDWRRELSKRTQCSTNQDPIKTSVYQSNQWGNLNITATNATPVTAEAIIIISDV